MPHVIVKLVAGRTEQQKSDLADALTKAVMTVLHSDEAAVSVAIEDISKQDWTDAVYKPDIAAKMDVIYKKPGYHPG